MPLPRLSVRSIAACLPLLILGACAAHPSGDGGPVDDASSAFFDAEAGTIDMNALMMQTMLLGNPGAPHEALAGHAGAWQVTGKSFFGPGGEAMEMVATAEVEMVLGGRVQIERFRSDFQGMPFEGMLLAGFDNLRQEHWHIWIDSFSTGYSAAWGGPREDGVLEFHGTLQDPMTPEGRPSRTEIAQHGDDRYTMTMFDTLPDGTEWVAMELDYRRGE